MTQQARSVTEQVARWIVEVEADEVPPRPSIGSVISSSTRSATSSPAWRRQPVLG